MSDRFTGKRVLVTGAAAGIGRATATLFAQNGATVAGLDRSWVSSAREITCITGDVTSGEDVRAAVTQAAGEEGLDILVANAGVIVIHDWLAATPDDWAHVLDVNVIGVTRCFQAAASNMIRNGRRGRLLATASMVGRRAFADGGAYCASKAAVISLVESAALALAEHGITVNAVAPGEVDTEMLWGTIRDAASADQRTPEQLRNEAVAQIPLGRMAQPDDIAHAFLFLASEASAHVTGVTVPVDGGRLLV